MSYEETDFDRLVGIVAPGAPIMAGNARVGISCFLQVQDDVYLVTCGHAFSKSAGETKVRTSVGSVIAILEINFLVGDDPLDAAMCKMTRVGLQLARKAYVKDHVFTFCDECITNPDEELDECEFYFWPTSQYSPSCVLRTKEKSYPHRFDFTDRNLGWEEQTIDSLIGLPIPTEKGDSGSVLLALYGGCFYYLGLCSGSDDPSCFTPIQSIITLAKLHFDTNEVFIWKPE